MIKILFVLGLAVFVNCDKFSQDEILKAQNQLIKDTIAKLQAMVQTDGTLLDKTIGAVRGPVQVLAFLNERLGRMDELMMAEGDRQAANGLPLIKKIFTDIHYAVYEWGRKTALTVDLPFYTLLNATDGKIALAKFAITAAVISWRCELDQERRTVHPTQCKDEQNGWNDWNIETQKTLNLLKEVIPKLKELKSNFWARLHQRMLDYIESGLPRVVADIKAEQSADKRAKYLCLINENLNLLNNVADSRPPAAK